MTLSQKMTNKFSKQDIFFLCAFLLGICLLVWKAHIGLGHADEHYYITIAKRFADHDTLFLDQWDISQLIGLFLGPLYSLFRFFHASNEGIVFGFRIFYIFFMAIVSGSIYLRLRSYGWISILSSLIYLLFSPYNIMALSYNSMSIGFLTLGLMLYPNKTHHKLQLCIVGVCMACAVLNNPYFILFYVFLTILLFFRKPFLSFHDWLWITIGALLVAISFILFFFSQISFQQLFEVLPYIIDSSHRSSFLHHILLDGYHLFLAFHVFLVLMVIEVPLALYIRHKEAKKQPFLFITTLIHIAAILFATMIRPYYPMYGGFTVGLLPFTLSGILILILYPEDSYLMSCMISSIFLSLMYAFSSNVGPDSFCAPLILACALTATLLFKHAPKCIYFACIFVCFLVYFKVTEDFGGITKEYTVVTEKGPLKGLRGTPEQVSQYEAKLNIMQEINQNQTNGFDLISKETWPYLAVEKPIVSSKTYLYAIPKEDFLAERNAYQSMHKDSYPTLLFLDNDNPLISSNDSYFTQFELLQKYESGNLYLIK